VGSRGTRENEVETPDGVEGFEGDSRIYEYENDTNDKVEFHFPNGCWKLARIVFELKR